MIFVFSRRDLVDWYCKYPNDKTPVISINDIGYDSPVPVSHRNVLKLFFDDVTPYLVKHDLHFPYYKEEEKRRSLVYFSDDMASKLIEFLQVQTSLQCEEQDIYIHCYAGVSRSVAVALFIYMIYGRFFGDVVNVDLDDCRLNSYVLGKLIKIQKEIS